MTEAIQCIGYVELAGGIAGAVAAVFLAMPTYRDVSGKQTSTGIADLARIAVGRAKDRMERLARDAEKEGIKFRPQDKADILRGIALVVLAFVLPLLNKIVLAIWPSWQFCLG